MRAPLALVAVVLGSLAVECVIFTGGTGGYVLEDAGGALPGDATGPSDGGAGNWIPDGGACRKAAECGDAGLICCVVAPGLDLSQATSVCQTGPCAGPVQLCGKNAECANNASCLLQTCTVGGTTVSIKACGVLPGVCETD
jgi:hypothetical protein